MTPAIHQFHVDNSATEFKAGDKVRDLFGRVQVVEFVHENTLELVGVYHRVHTSKVTKI